MGNGHGLARAKFCALKVDHTRAGRLQKVEQPQQRALARAAGAHDGQDLALGNVQLLDGYDRPAAIDAGHVAQAVERRAHGSSVCPCRRKMTKLVRKAMASRINPRAMASSKLPLLVSNTMAVVSTRVRPGDVAAHQHDRAHLRDDGAKAGHHGRNHAGARLVEHRPGGLAARGAQCPHLQPQRGVHAPHSRHGEAGHQREGDDGLGQDHGAWRIERGNQRPVQAAQRPTPRQQDVDEQADDHRWEGQPRIDQRHRQPLAAKAGQAQQDAHRDTQKRADQERKTRDAQRQRDDLHQRGIPRQDQAQGSHKTTG